MDKPLYVISFTGHRPTKLGGYNPNPMRTWVKAQMLDAVNRAITKFGETHEIVIVWGGALGVDQWAAQLANHLGLRHVCIIPFWGFEKRWPWASKEAFGALCETTDINLLRQLFDHDVHGNTAGVMPVHSSDDNEYNPAAYQTRNKMMVDVADAVIAVWDGSPGGTANCVNYAQGRKPIVRINPNNR